MDTNNLFKPDRNQVIAGIAMVCVVFAFAGGEMVIGFVLFGAAVVFLVWRPVLECAQAGSSRHRRNDTGEGRRTNQPQQGMT
jgi:hypothetical protein